MNEFCTVFRATVGWMATIRFLWIGLDHLGFFTVKAYGNG